MNTYILSLIFFGCLGWLIAVIFEDCRDVVNAKVESAQQWAKTNLGWPILAAGLGSILFFTLIYDDLGLVGNERVDFIRTAVLTIGAFGGAYGLVLGTRRQTVLEKQTQQGQDQLFNDHLGRGVEMMGHEEVAIKVTGIKVLEDLALTSNNYDRIRTIIESYLVASARKPLRANGQLSMHPDDTPDNNSEKAKRHDLFELVAALIRINQKLNKPTELLYLDLDFFNCSPFLSGEISVDVALCHLRNTTFHDTNFTDTSLYQSDLTDVYFFNTNLTDVIFEYSSLAKVYFMNTDLNNCKFVFTDCTHTDFQDNNGLTENQLSDIFFEEEKPPKNVPDQVKIPLHHAYKWSERGGYHYRQLVNPDPTLTEDKIKSLEHSLNQIPGGPPEEK